MRQLGVPNRYSPFPRLLTKLQDCNSNSPPTTLYIRREMAGNNVMLRHFNGPHDLVNASSIQPEMTVHTHWVLGLSLDHMICSVLVQQKVSGARLSSLPTLWEALLCHPMGPGTTHPVTKHTWIIHTLHKHNSTLLQKRNVWGWISQARTGNEREHNIAYTLTFLELQYAAMPLMHVYTFTQWRWSKSNHLRKHET